MVNINALLTRICVFPGVWINELKMQFRYFLSFFFVEENNPMAVLVCLLVFNPKSVKYLMSSNFQAEALT